MLVTAGVPQASGLKRELFITSSLMLLAITDVGHSNFLAKFGDNRKT